ncbi:MAG: hypothetical protein WAT22_07710 [Saprospiraceae bacterium]
MKDKYFLHILTIFIMVTIFISCSKPNESICNNEEYAKLNGLYTPVNYNLITGPHKIFVSDGNGSFMVGGFKYDTTYITNDSIELTHIPNTDSFSIQGIHYPISLWPDLKSVVKDDSLLFEYKKISGPIVYSLRGFVKVKGDSLLTRYVYSDSNLDYSQQFDATQVRVYTGNGVKLM